MACGAPVAVSISPESPDSRDDLVATKGSNEVGLVLEWAVDGSFRGDLTGDRIPASETERGQVWRVALVDGGRVLGEDQVVIGNAAPSVTGSVASAPPGDQPLELVLQSEDPDGDAVSYQVTWELDGVVLRETSDTLPAGTGTRGQVLDISVVPTDGQRDGEPLALRTTFGNSPPRLTGATISPSPLVASATARCEAQGWTDQDGDPAGGSVVWTVNGTTVSTEAELPPGSVKRGDRVVCTLTPFDGFDGGDAVTSAPVEVENSPPLAESVVLTPSEPVVGDTVRAELVGASDADGDRFTVSWSWKRDISATSTTRDSYYLVSGEHRHGTRIEATATLTDDFGASSQVSAVVLAVNTPPVISSISVSSSGGGYANDAFTATAVVEDADQDTPKLTYSWKVRGTELCTTATCSSSTLAKHDMLELTVTADDEWGGVVSKTVTIDVKNHPPTAPTVELDPADGSLGQDVICDVVVDGEDTVDGDSIDYTFSWYRNSILWTGVTATTTYAGDTIPSEQVRRGDSWRCIGVSDDGDGGTAGSTPVSTTLSTCPTLSVATVALDGPLTDHSMCWYLGAGGQSCDAVCGHVGGSNTATEVPSAARDVCSGPITTSVTGKFFAGRNAARWSSSAFSASGAKTLGHGDVGGIMYDKCATGSTSIGTWPTQTNSSSKRALVCACF